MTFMDYLAPRRLLEKLGEDRMGIAIYVVTGKNVSHIVDPCYHYIFVGDEKKAQEDMLTDATGDSIADKNPYYCELTALYWLWKNQELDDYVGMCHYRRFFDLQDTSGKWIVKQASAVADIAEEISAKRAVELLMQYDVILPVHAALAYTVEQDYCMAHRRQDWEEMKRVLKEMYPDYIPAAEKVFQSNRVHFYNMFVMRRDLFKSYMKWLFDILSEVEARIQIPYDDKVQRRVFGYLAERLFNVYIVHHRLQVKEQPIIFLQDNGQEDRSQYKNWKYKFKEKCPKIALKLKKLQKSVM